LTNTINETAKPNIYFINSIFFLFLFPFAPKEKTRSEIFNYNEIFCQGHKKSMHAQILRIFFKFKQLYESILKKNEFLADIASLD